MTQRRSSLDGGWTAPAAIAGSVVIFDVASGEQIGDPIHIHDDEIATAEFRGDGKEAAFGGGAGKKFSVWDLDPEHWVTAACQIAGRNLTSEEWRTNIGDLANYHPTCPGYD